MGPAGAAGKGCDHGSGTVLTLGLVTVIVALAAGTGLVGQAVVARHRAAAAADLAALAAAAIRVDPLAGGDPRACAVAARVAADNGARLGECRLLAGAAVEVGVGVPIPGPAGPLGPALGRARAGPDPAGASWPVVPSRPRSSRP